MALTLTENSVYEPSFDENTGLYVDKCPYRPYQRNRTTYKCLCSSTASFSTTAQFVAHIKGKGHKDFIENYEKHTKQDKDTEKEIKQYRVDNELLERKNEHLERENKSLRDKNLKTIETVKGLRKEKEADSEKRVLMRNNIKELKNKNKNKDEEIKNLKLENLKKNEEIQNLQSELQEMKDKEFKEIIHFEE